MGKDVIPVFVPQDDSKLAIATDSENELTGVMTADQLIEKKSPEDPFSQEANKNN